MQHLVLQFSNPGDMIIDAFASMHTTSLAALLCHHHSIAFKASQEQWTSTQATLPDQFLALSDERPAEADLSDLREAANLPKPLSTPPSPSYDPTSTSQTSTLQTILSH